MLKNGWKVGENDLKHVLNHFPHFPPIFEVFWSFYGKISFLGVILGSFWVISPISPSKTIKVEKILKKCMFHLKSSLDSEKRIKKWFKPIPGVENLDTSSYSVQKVIFGLLRPILASPQGALTRDKNKNLLGRG